RQFCLAGTRTESGAATAAGAGDRGVSLGRGFQSAGRRARGGGGNLCLRAAAAVSALYAATDAAAWAAAGVDQSGIPERRRLGAQLPRQPIAGAWYEQNLFLSRVYRGHRWPAV